ncbi:MDH1B-like protein [Mya arenaria]|uniref:Malate dehydrogenase, cytoplasmic n=1 Tax=Mya arenaria TaxID=6604 RepID=A0ABY7E702_MYAAR|nr:MDH1B-like protein [Mya arenaria]
MAKFVIAGEADCPYYARAELLGDKLAINLPDFKLHKIVKTPDEWREWLSSECQLRGWKHEKSPLVWRELIDRGGKGVLIGGANEFQEYAQGYYGFESSLVSDDMKNIAAENKQLKVEKDKEEADYKALSNPVHVCITNASSNVCYNMMDGLCRGEVLGSGVEMIIHLLDSSDQAEYLDGTKMEVEDLAHGLMKGVVVETDPNVAFKDCSYIVILDEIEQGEKSKDAWIKENHELFVKYAKIIDSVASKSVKVLIAGYGPVNFNASMMIKNTPSIPRQNIVAVSRMVENQAKSVIAERLKINTAGVVDLIIWGNPNGEHYIDLSRSRVHGYDGAIIGPDSFSLSTLEMVFDSKWATTEYLELVKTKKSRTEEALQHPATFSMASAINSTLMHWCNGSPSSQFFSLGVSSEGWYGVPQDLVFSFPVTMHPKGYWIVVQDIDVSEEKELSDEGDATTGGSATEGETTTTGEETASAGEETGTAGEGTQEKTTEEAGKEGTEGGETTDEKTEEPVKSDEQLPTE